MESKVIMYDANGTEVGETYTRRARQLVKQQRAVWADDTHTAIRFAPDTTEEWEAEPTSAPAPTAHTPVSESSYALYALAEKRVRDRNRVILHSVALIPVLIIIFIWGVSSWNARRGGEMFILFMGIGWGAWVTSYICHLRNYIRKYNTLLGPGGSWSARRRMALDVEVDRLRRMGYTK